MARQRSIVRKDIVKLKDVASVYSKDAVLQTKAEGLVLYDFKGKQENKAVINILYIVERVQQLQQNTTVESFGESDVIVQREIKKANPIRKTACVMFVSLICFFGSAFSIMAFHNDIGIQQVFGKAFHIGLMLGQDMVSEATGSLVPDSRERRKFPN